MSDDQVLVTHGANSGLAASIVALVNPGDRVIIPEPTYSLYADLVRMVGAEPVFVPLIENQNLDLERINDLAADAAMVVLCHPCNPTGSVFTRVELEYLADLSHRNNILVLADEAYSRIIFEGTEFVSTLEVPALEERLVYCQTFSKTWAMTGWRLGYMVLPKSLCDPIARTHQTLTGPINAATQRAALAALTSDSDWPKEAVREYQSRRDVVLEQFGAFDSLEMVPPKGTFYAFARFNRPWTSSEFVEVARNAGVALRSGSEFGPSGEGYFRISFAASSQLIREGAARLSTVLA